MCYFVDDDSQTEDEWNILAFFDLHTIFVSHSEEFLRYRGNKMTIFHDFEFTRSEISFDFKNSQIRLNFEFLSAQQIEFTAEDQRFQLVNLNRYVFDLLDIGNHFTVF